MQYIKRVNTIEAIQNKGDILTDVIPFLNEHGIAFEYKGSFIEGKQISVMLHEEYVVLNLGEYLVINKRVISIMSVEDFESKYQEDDKVVKKNINTEMTTNITLDTSRAQRAFDLLADTVKQIKDGEQSTKQPHVRIEFDDIRDVPKVWVDGELIGEVNDKPLFSLKVDWDTDTATENHKGFDINYYDLTGERPMSRGLHEGTPR